MSNNGLILKASAGTGKTYRMSLEYIAALCNGVDYKSILVMTFTKKATAEIKERILKFLEEMLNGTATGKDVEKNIRSNYHDIKIDIKEMRIIYEKIIKDKDNLKIYTIDAFTNIIFKEAIAPVMNVYDYEMIDDDKNKFLLEKILEENGFGFMKKFVLNNVEKGIENYISLLENLINDRWKYFLINKEEIKKGKIPYNIKENLVERYKNVLNCIEEIANKKGNSIIDTLSTSGKELYVSTNNQDIHSLLVDNYNTILKGNIWNGNKTKGKDVDELRESLVEEYEDFKDTLRKVVFNEKIIPFENEIFEFASHVYDLYDDIKKREKKFTFSDISNYTFMYLENESLNFVKDNKVTEDFYDVIGGKIDTIFIDEFQDTSVLQWQILSKIINSSKNILCVGDEKQSIYGWRGGEKKLFEKLENILNVRSDNLDTCYRSHKMITKYCNEVFNVFKSYEEKRWGFIPVNYIEKKSHGYIEHIRGTEDNSALVLMVESIKERFHNNYDGIGIIARTNKDLKAIANELENNEIPYLLEAKSNIINNPMINEIFCLLKYLCKEEYLSLLNFLSMGKLRLNSSDMEIFLDNKSEICQYLDSKEGDISFVDKLSEYGKILLNKLKKIKSQYKNDSITSEILILTIIEEFALVDEYSNKNHVANVYRFLEMIKEYNYIDDFLTELILDPDNEKFSGILVKEKNVVTLVSVHKSKGLEYDTVYYYHNPSKKMFGNNLEFFIELGDNFNKIDKYMFTMGKYEKVLKELDEYKSLVLTKELKSEQEELNVLYVALTRPVTNLFVVFSKENKNSDFFDESTSIAREKIDEQKFLSKNDMEQSKGKEENKNESEKTKFEENKNIIVEELSEKYEIINKNADFSDELLRKVEKDMLPLEKIDIFKNDFKRLAGIVVHYFMENLTGITKEEIDYARIISYSNYGSILSIEEIDVILSTKNIQKMIELSIEKDIFYNWDAVYSEYVIFDNDEKEYRIDRLMVSYPTEYSTGRLYIVDFKTGSHEDEQIENYQRILGKILEEKGHKVKIYPIGEKAVNNLGYTYEIISDFVEIKL
ncbi:UvrD-helicase domain-containing protein [Fusobacterium sp. PH5-44]|uniref:UvrD-helicase domain-containing protein n=1 Tax=unclassified Fusobacterium TaxID=2648384 RepID=UPI003D19F497